MNSVKIAADLRERAAALLLQAQAFEHVADLLDPPTPKTRKPRTARPAKQDAAKRTRRKPKPQAVLHATTGVGPSPRELDKSDLVHVTSE